MTSLAALVLEDASGQDVPLKGYAGRPVLIQILRYFG